VKRTALPFALYITSFLTRVFLPLMNLLFSAVPPGTPSTNEINCFSFLESRDVTVK